MGRTYEALSHGRANRVAETADSVAPKSLLPIFPPTVPASEDNVRIDDERPTIFDDLAEDNSDIPFVEVGGPKGSQPIYGPLVDPVRIRLPEQDNTSAQHRIEKRAE